MQAAEIDLDLQTRPSEGPNTRLPCEFFAIPFSGFRGISAENPFLSLVTLTFDLNIQALSSEGPNTSFL